MKNVAASDRKGSQEKNVTAAGSLKFLIHNHILVAAGGCIAVNVLIYK